MPVFLLGLGPLIAESAAWQATRTAVMAGVSALPFSAKAGDLAKKGWSATKALFTKNTLATTAVGTAGAEVAKKSFSGKALGVVGGIGTSLLGGIGVAAGTTFSIVTGAAIIGAVALGGYAIYKAFSSDDKKQPAVKNNNISENQLQTALAPAMSPNLGVAQQPMMMNGMVAGGANIASAHPAGVGYIQQQQALSQNNSWANRVGGSNPRTTSQVQSLMDRQAAEQMASQQQH